MDNASILWREEGSSEIALYTTSFKVNATSWAGRFWTVLTNIDGTKLTSTATIDRVSLDDDGINITCRGVNAEAWQLLQVEGIIIIFTFV